MKALVPTPEVAAVALRRGENATLGKSQVDALLSTVATRLREHRAGLTQPGEKRRSGHEEDVSA